MKCPICGGEMHKGGLVAGGINVAWLPEEQLEEESPLGVYVDCKSLKGERNHLLKQMKIPNAYFCEKCDKVTGLFDVAGRDDSLFKNIKTLFSRRSKS